MSYFLISFGIGFVSDTWGTRDSYIFKIHLKLEEKVCETIIKINVDNLLIHHLGFLIIGTPSLKNPSF